VALAESSISGKLGCKVTLPEINARLDNVLFGELASLIIVSIRPENQSKWETLLTEKLGNNWQQIGEVKSTVLNINNLINLDIKTITDTWENAIDNRL